MVNPCFDKIHVSVVLKNKKTHCLCTKAAKKKKCCHFVINFVESGWALVTYMLSSKWSMSTVQCPTKSIDFFSSEETLPPFFYRKGKPPCVPWYRLLALIGKRHYLFQSIWLVFYLLLSQTMHGSEQNVWTVVHKMCIWTPLTKNESWNDSLSNAGNSFEPCQHYIQVLLQVPLPAAWIVCWWLRQQVTGVVQPWYCWWFSVIFQMVWL